MFVCLFFNGGGCCVPQIAPGLVFDLLEEAAACGEYFYNGK